MDGLSISQTDSSHPSVTGRTADLVKDTTARSGGLGTGLCPRLSACLAACASVVRMVVEEDQHGKLRGFAMTTATDVGFAEMRIVGVGGAEDEVVRCAVVLDEVAGDRQLPIMIGQAEAFSLAARLGGIQWRRPMTYQFVAALVQALGGRVRQVRIDRVVEEAYAATVEVEGPLGMQSVDARPSDVLNLAVLVDARIFAAPEVLREAEATRAGDSAGAVLLRQALVAPPMTIEQLGM
jgi:bifunctional DNase/RNase